MAPPAADFEGSPRSIPEVRRFVTAAAADCGHPELATDAELVVAELATNVVVHALGPFRVEVSALDARGLRVAVTDHRPEEVPIWVGEVPPGPVARAATGRGLRIVAGLATGWGVDVGPASKTIWVELTGDRVRAPVRPPLAAGPATVDAFVQVRLLGLPVELALTSGMAMEDAIRDVQLGLYEHGASAEAEHFGDLVGRSAHARHAGLQAALDAAARGESRYEVVLDVDASLVEATAALGQLLQELQSRLDLDQGASAEIVAYRSWLEQEIAAQLTGRAPSPWPGLS